jgi:hypothetical protein
MKDSMHTKYAFPSLAFLLVGFLSTARAEAQKAEPSQAEAAAAIKVGTRAPLEFGVTGLTKDNLEKVQESLTALTSQVYVCNGCKDEDATAGKCPPCNVERTAKKEPMLFKAIASLDTASIRLVPVTARTLRYSDLEGALTKNSVHIESAKFPIAGESRLVLRGGTKENAATIEKALTDSKLFELVQAEFDTPSGEIRVVVHANATPPMHDKVTSVIDALGTKAKLTDVIWGPTPVPTKA